MGRCCNYFLLYVLRMQHFPSSFLVLPYHISSSVCHLTENSSWENNLDPSLHRSTSWKSQITFVARYLSSIQIRLIVYIPTTGRNCQRQTDRASEPISVPLLSVEINTVFCAFTMHLFTFRSRVRKGSCCSWFYLQIVKWIMLFLVLSSNR